MKKIISLLIICMLTIGIVGCGNKNKEVELNQNTIYQEKEEYTNNHEVKNEDAYNKGYNYFGNPDDEYEHLVMIYAFTANMRYYNNIGDLDVVSWNENNHIEPYTIKAEDVDDYCWGQLQFLIKLAEDINDEDALELLREIENNFDKNDWSYYENKAAEMYQNREKDTENKQNEIEEPVQKETKSTTVSVEQKQALKKAEQYIDIMGFSKEGLKSQLEYDGFEDDSIEYAVENVDANWNEEALEKAKQYMDLMGFSKEGMRSQLEYDGFTDSEIEYAINKLY